MEVITSLVDLTDRQSAVERSAVQGLRDAELEHGGRVLAGITPVISSNAFVGSDCASCGTPEFNVRSGGRALVLCAHCINALRVASCDHRDSAQVCYGCEPHYDYDGLLQFTVHRTIAKSDLADRIADGMVYIDSAGAIHIASNEAEREALAAS